MKKVLLPSLLLLLIVSFVNGSRKPLLLISMDGMRSSAFEDYLKENPDSTFHKRLINIGLKADYVTPIFPSLTFPNHWSIVTGVYAEQHGIVGNQIYDPTANIRVSLSGGSANGNEVQWWNRSDPIWLLARKKSLKTAASFWPGSEVWSRTPDIFLTYSNQYSFYSRIDELINWFLKFNLDFACIYFNEPDSTGHTYGPNNQYYKDKVKEMNGVIGYLFDELERNNLLDNMNIILTGDHGMAQSDRKPTAFVDYMDTNLIDFNRSVINFVSSIYPKDMSRLDELYQGLQKIPNATIYYKNEVPPRYHYTNSDRIGPIVLVAEEGFLFSADGSWDGTKGSHGYDNQLASMRTIFLATGPDFKKGENMPGFENVNIQPLMCKLLDLESSQSSGSVAIFEPYLKSFAIRIDRISVLNYFIFILAIISFVNSSMLF